MVISIHGTNGTTQRGDPIDSALLDHPRPMAILAAPAPHITQPRAIDAMMESIDNAISQVVERATPVTLPRKNTIASVTSASWAKSTTPPNTNQ